LQGETYPSASAAIFIGLYENIINRLVWAVKLISNCPPVVGCSVFMHFIAKLFHSIYSKIISGCVVNRFPGSFTSLIFCQSRSARRRILGDRLLGAAATEHAKHVWERRVRRWVTENQP